MADPAHIDRLMKGVDAWNAWRRKNPNIRPDLSETNLSGKDLRGAILSEADLRRANLSGANLSNANLSRAGLRDTDLSGAILSRLIREHHGKTNEKKPAQMLIPTMKLMRPSNRSSCHSGFL
jgi:Pentapeptide repeats (8 copies)